MWQNAHDAYLESRVLSAEPLALVKMLYQAAIAAVKEARRHLANREIAARARAITKACTILTELATSLDHERGGELSLGLARLYDYMSRRLIEANFKQTDQPLEEVLGLLSTLVEGWEGIQPDATPESQAAAVEPREVTPEPWTVTPEPAAAKPGSWVVPSESRMAPPSPWVTSPELQPATPAPWAVSSELRPETPGPWAVSSEPRPATPGPWAVSSEPRPETPGPWAVASEPQPATPGPWALPPESPEATPGPWASCPWAQAPSEAPPEHSSHAWSF
jgi:flagellar protein FliS